MWFTKLQPGSKSATIDITNLGTNSVVQTGFVVGTAVSAGTIGVQLDGGTIQTAIGTSNWRFALPQGPGRWKTGTKHTITVGDLRGGTLYDSRTVTVFQGENKDVNGDGYADVVVGSDGANSGQGKVYVFESTGSSGLLTSPTTTLSDPDATNWDEFGCSLAAADLNGDGYADVVVGVYRGGGMQGKVHVYQSTGSSGIPTSPTTTLSDPQVAFGDEFGYSLAAADVNGDGYADVVVGAPGASSSQGKVYVYQSTGSSGIPGGPTTTLSDPGATANDDFGFSLVAADLNQDGYSDLVVGANGASSDQGKVYIYRSTGGSGIPTSPTTTLSDPGATNFDYFGGSLAAGDINGDGYPDLAVGAYGVSSTQGAAYVYQSTGSAGIPTNPTITLSDPEATANDYFGGAFTVTDVNGDGYLDVVVGASETGSGQGKVYMYQSAGSSGVPTSPTTVLSDPAGTANDYFGVSLTAADINGDGYPDVVIGANGTNLSQGTVYVYESAGSSGILASPTATLPDPKAASSDTFGGALLSN